MGCFGVRRERRNSKSSVLLRSETSERKGRPIAIVTDRPNPKSADFLQEQNLILKLMSLSESMPDRTLFIASCHLLFGSVFTPEIAFGFGLLVQTPLQLFEFNNLILIYFF